MEPIPVNFQDRVMLNRGGHLGRDPIAHGAKCSPEVL